MLLLISKNRPEPKSRRTESKMDVDLKRVCLNGRGKNKSNGPYANARICYVNIPVIRQVLPP